jgi:CYTH domain-containing protein
MEIELSSEADTITFPKHVEVIKEVTDDDNFKNSNLANI